MSINANRITCSWNLLVAKFQNKTWIIYKMIVKTAAEAVVRKSSTGGRSYRR
jgi:hypothetical protein